MKYSELQEPQKHLIIDCIGRDDVSELKAGVWDGIVRLALGMSKVMVLRNLNETKGFRRMSPKLN